MKPVDIVEDANKCNTLLCVATLLLLIFVGGEFALTLPTWLWVIIGIALIASAYRAIRED